MSRCVVVISLALVGACARKAAPVEAPAPEAPDTVSFQFVPTPGWTAVRQDLTTQRKERDGVAQRELRVGSRCDVRHVASEGVAMVVRTEGCQLDEFGLEDPTVPSGMEGAMRAYFGRVVALDMAHGVDVEGSAVPLGGREHLRAELEQLSSDLVGAVRDSVSGDPATLQVFDAVVAGMASQLDPDRLLGEELEAWNWRVAFWHDGAFELGTDYELPPETPDGGVQTTTRFSVIAREPCHDEEGAPACVQVGVVHRFDPDQLLALSRQQLAPVWAQMEAQAGAPLGLTLEAATREHRRWLWLEPDSLRTWYEIEEEVSRTEVASADGTVVTSDVERSERAWRWSPPR